MVVKLLKPTSAGRRKMSVIAWGPMLTKDGPVVKGLLRGIKRHSGRNNRGVITVRCRGGGAKHKLRLVDLRQTKLGIPATVKAIEYDPNRSAYIALIYFLDGEKSYILAPADLKVGDKVVYNENTKIKVGNRLALKNIPTGIAIHNIELQPGKGGQMVRSAGSFAMLTGFDRGYAQVKMPSGEIRIVPENAYASIGAVSNPDHSNVRIGKAGRKRLMGRRPHVRGKAKNPVDHPHGGGEGNSPIGLKHPKTPWGKPTKGYKTRKRNKSSRYIIKPRTKKRKGKK